MAIDNNAAGQTYSVLSKRKTIQSVVGVMSIETEDVIHHMDENFRNVFESTTVGRPWADGPTGYDVPPTPGTDHPESFDDRLQDIDPRPEAFTATQITFWSQTAGTGNILMRFYEHDVIWWGVGTPTQLT